MNNKQVGDFEKFQYKKLNLMLLHSPQNGLEIQLMGSKVHRQCVSVKGEGIHGPVVLMLHTSV